MSLSRMLFVPTLVLGLALGLAPGVARAEPPSELGEIHGDVIWVDFWASWCTPCRRSFPWMNSTLSRYRNQGLQVIGINLDKERALADEFLRETPAEFDVVYDPGGELAERYGVQAMPSSFLIDADGNVLETHYGFRLEDADEYVAGIERALRAAGNNSIRLEDGN